MKLFTKIIISMFIIGGAQSLLGQDNNDVNNKNLLLSKWQLNLYWTLFSRPLVPGRGSNNCS
jgi:hypothetical protein